MVKVAMYFEQLNFESMFVGVDLGEGKNHIMIKAFGLKKDRNAKCRSCFFYQKETCSFISEGFSNKENAACSRYQSKKSIKKNI